MEHIPYCQFLASRSRRRGRRHRVAAALRAADRRHAALPAIHGGAIGAFLETAAIVEVLRTVDGDTLPKPVDLTIAYLRSARAVDTLARTIVTKHGRRVVNVRVEAWQDDPARPVATRRGTSWLRADDAPA